MPFGYIAVYLYEVERDIKREGTGNAGTLFWIDPKEEMIAIYMMQVSDPDRIALRNPFRTMVQSAVIE